MYNTAAFWTSGNGTFPQGRATYQAFVACHRAGVGRLPCDELRDGPAYDLYRDELARRASLDSYAQDWRDAFIVDHGREPSETEAEMFPEEYGPPASYHRAFARQGR